MLGSESCVDGGEFHLKTLSTLFCAIEAEVELTINNAKTPTSEETEYEDGILRFRVRM